MSSKKSKPNGGSGPWMIDASLLLAAGIDPKTLLPIKVANHERLNIRDMISVMDEQAAVNRYAWGNFPGSLTGQDVERMLYYKFQLAFFYLKETENFYLMPYTLDGNVDYYGRFVSVHPVPWGSGQEGGEGAKKGKLEGEINQAQYDLLSQKKLLVVYDVQAKPLGDPPAGCDGYCVLLNDYTRQWSNQNGIPRSILQKDIIKVEADIIPMARTALLASVGTRAVRVQNSEEGPNVTAASAQIYDAAVTGKLMIPVNGMTDFQDLANAPSGKPEDYLGTMQAVDNFRLSALGVSNGGVFEKKAHVLEKEEAANNAPNEIIYNDGLSIRQNFCNIVNSIWPLGVWCEEPDYAKGAPSEAPTQEYAQSERGQGGAENAI